MISQCKYLLNARKLGKAVTAFQFAVIHCGEWEGSSKGPDLEAEKNSFYSADTSHSPREGCLTRMGLLWMLPSASVSMSRT